MIKIYECNYTPKSLRESTARKVSQSFLEELVDSGVAKDISDCDDYSQFANLRKIYFSTGKNGIDGGGFIDDNGKMYVIIGVNSETYKLFNID